MSVETSHDMVRWYDASVYEEDTNTAAGYFHPPLGEAIVADLVDLIPSLTHTVIENAGHADHFRLPTASLSMLLGRATTLLRREDRYLKV